MLQIKQSISKDDEIITCEEQKQVCGGVSAGLQTHLQMIPPPEESL